MKKGEVYQLADHDKFFNLVTGFKRSEEFPEAGYYVLSEPFETHRGDETAVIRILQVRGYLRLDAVVRVRNEFRYDPIYTLESDLPPKELLEALGYEVFTC